MSIVSDEVNFLVYRYLQESGYQHSAFSFGLESHISQSNINGSLVPPGALINIVQKGIQFIEGELCINDDGTLVENLDTLGSIPLIDAVIPEALAERATTIYRLVSQKTELAKKVLPPAYFNDEKQDGVIILNGHNTEVFSCSWHPSSKFVATGAADGIAGIWSLESPEIEMVELDHNGVNKTNQSADVTSISWHPEGQRLATTSALDHGIRIWTIEGNLITTLVGHTDLILSLNWNSSGSFLLSASLDKKCIVWNGEKLEKIQEFQFHAGPVVETDWQNNATFASCSTDKTIAVCKVGCSEPLKLFVAHLDVINCVQWDPTGMLLASCADDKSVKLWNMKQDKPVYELNGHTKEVTQIKWSLKKRLASASYDTNVRIWDTEHFVCLYTLAQHYEPVNSISFNPDGKYLVSGALDGLVNVWSLQDGTCVHTHRGSGGIFEVQWSPNNLCISICQSDKIVKIFDTQKIVAS